MDVVRKVRKNLEKSRQEATKYHEQGNVVMARTEYANCARQLRYLAGLSKPSLREGLINESRKYDELVVSLGGQPVAPPHGPGLSAPTVESPGVTGQQSKLQHAVLAEKPKVNFAGVAGLDEVKEHIREAIIDPFVYPDEYAHFGVQPGGGILLYGPPGCGKTMIAAAAASEADAVFISLKSSDIKNMYVGESEKNVKTVFTMAEQYPRAIIFFDEIDALASERSSRMEVHERSLVSELLAQMDGLEVKGEPRNVLVLAATNRPWGIDIALRRSGRFDTTIFVPHPDRPARQRLLEINLQDKPVSASVSLDRLTDLTEGYASSEIAGICQKAARIPLRERISDNLPRRELVMADFEQVLEHTKTVLDSWYRKALKELAHSEESETFAELVLMAQGYRFRKER